MKYNINLLKKKQETILDKGIYFALNYLRYILVITQLVVIGVLFFRFHVDHTIIDLKESIDQKQEIIDATKPLIVEAQKIDTRVTGIKNTIKKQKTLSNSLDYTLSIFPDTLYLSSLTIENGTTKLMGIATNPQHLQGFYNRLRKENKFKLVSMNNLQRDESNLKFVLTLSNFEK